MNPLAKMFIVAVVASGMSEVSHGLQVQTFAVGNNNFYMKPSDGLEFALGNYASVAKSADGKSFISFCIEENEYLDQGGLYNVALSNAANAGGSWTPTPGFDVISKGTAFLYEQFALGTLGTVTYSDTNSIYKLQQMIWFLEGETGLGVNHFEYFLKGHFTSIEAAQLDYTGSHVRVMNITDSKGNRKQDQLVYMAPDGGATAALLGLSLGGMIWMRRRFAVA